MPGENLAIFSVNTADIFNAIGGGSPLSIIDSVLHPSYTIRHHGRASIALPFSGMVSIQPSGGASIVTAPIEKGQYQSINKVVKPGRVICDIVISALTGLTSSLPNLFDLTLTSQSATLTTIKRMFETAATYDIDTPKETYESYDLIDYSYTVNSQRGVSLLVISLIFEQVRQQMTVSIASSQAKNKATHDHIQRSTTGTGSEINEGSARPATVDGLKTAWTNLHTAVNKTANRAAGKVEAGFNSAINTVNGPLTATKTAAIETLNALTKAIQGAIT